MILDAREVVIDAETGRARQAGADTEGPAIDQLRVTCERSLFAFAVIVLGRDRLTTALHRPICDWLQASPPYRKLLLLPRDHYKTTVVSQAMPMHLAIQPAEANGYWPGKLGTDLRIMLAGETEARSKRILRWMQTQYEDNDLLRGLWPHRVWDDPRRQAKKWNETEILLPRAVTADAADVTIWATGVGGASTGSHFDVLIKDDLVTLEAANSPIVMEATIEWHRASRALMDDPDRSLEILAGTRWAVHDLYSWIAQNDPSVAITQRAIVEDGQPILPELFSLATIARLQQEFGVLFPLLYMNQASDPALTDFDLGAVRPYTLEGTTLVFDEDGRDVALAHRQEAPAPTLTPPPGTPLDRAGWQALYQPGSGLRRVVR